MTMTNTKKQAAKQIATLAPEELERRINVWVVKCAQEHGFSSEYTRAWLANNPQMLIWA